MFTKLDNFLKYKNYSLKRKMCISIKMFGYTGNQTSPADITLICLWYKLQASHDGWRHDSDACDAVVKETQDAIYRARHAAFSVPALQSRSNSASWQTTV